MKYLVAIIGLLLCCLGIHAQQLNQTDAKGLKQGVWKKNYDNSAQLRYQGQFKDDLPVGEFKYYAKNGKLSAQIIHGGAGVSYATNYFESGKKASEGKFINQKKDSVWSFYDEAGSLLSTETYVNDKKSGIARVYHKNGSVSLEQNFLNGIHHGLSTIYFDDGIKRAEDTYVSGKLHGMSKTFGVKGNLLEQGKYNMGSKDGEWIIYNEDGSIYSKTIYINGDKGEVTPVNGVFDEYFGNELLKSRYTYKDGKLNGKFIIYHDGGTWDYIEKTDPRTEETDTYRIEKDHVVKMKGSYINGLLHGMVEEYDENGTLLNVTNYINGEAK